MNLIIITVLSLTLNVVCILAIKTLKKTNEDLCITYKKLLENQDKHLNRINKLLDKKE